MDALRVSIVCLLLKMTFDPVTAQLLAKPRCSTCQQGYFVSRNCSEIKEGTRWRREGIRCKLCTDCSAAGQATLVECSTYADSQCGDISTPVSTLTSTPTKPTVSAPELWIIHTVIVFSLIIFLLLTCFLILLFRRNHQTSKFKDLDPL